MQRIIFVLVILILSAGPSLAREYISPEDLTDQERIDLMSVASRYQACLRKESMAVIDNYGDVRQVAGVAMEICKPALDEVDEWMMSRNLDPDYRNAFIRNTRNKSVRAMLPQLMSAKSARAQ